MELEDQITSLKLELAEVKAVVIELTQALSISLEDTRKAREYVAKVNELVRQL